jgi:hypothetical protein
VPLLSALEEWLRKQRSRLSRSASVAEPIDYMLKRREVIENEQRISILAQAVGRLPDSRRHQLSAIAQCNELFGNLALEAMRNAFPSDKVSDFG